MKLCSCRKFADPCLTSAWVISPNDKWIMNFTSQAAFVSIESANESSQNVNKYKKKDLQIKYFFPQILST